MRGICAYCGKPGDMTRDHVVPRSLAERLQARGVVIPAHLLRTVPAHSRCNNHKGSSRWVPRSWAPLLDELNALIPGARVKFKVWDGSTKIRRIICRWCEKVIKGTAPACYRCRVPVHEACRTPHMGRCRKARAVAAA